MDKNSFLNFLRQDGKKRKGDLLAVLATGVLLIIIGNTFFSPVQSIPEKINSAEKTQSSAIEDEDTLEKKLAEIFSSIQGAGKVKVMVTLKSGSEIIVAEEHKVKESGDGMDTENKMVLLSQGNGIEVPLVLQERYPEIEGIVIVAQGGDDIMVKDALSRGAQALLNVPAHKVEIFKME